MAPSVQPCDVPDEICINAMECLNIAGHMRPERPIRPAHLHPDTHPALREKGRVLPTVPRPPPPARTIERQAKVYLHIAV